MSFTKDETDNLDNMEIIDLVETKKQTYFYSQNKQYIIKPVKGSLLYIEDKKTKLAQIYVVVDTLTEKRGDNKKITWKAILNTVFKISDNEILYLPDTNLYSIHLNNHGNWWGAEEKKQNNYYWDSLPNISKS